MRVLLIHWKPEAAATRLEQLREAGFEADVLAPNGFTGLRGRAEFAKAILIDLSRLPLQGRAVGIELRKRAASRRVPIVFVGGIPEKVEATRQVLPDAAYMDWDEVADGLKAAIQRAPKSPVVPDTMAAYSGTPLAKKLGIRKDTVLALLNAPGGFEAQLEPLPPGVRIVSKPSGAQRIVLFVTAMKDLGHCWRSTVDASDSGATVWIAWPKKASGTVTDVTEDIVRKYGLERGWVDYKICAIDATWSGLAFSKRK
jgi:hypothetical protein